MSDTPECCMRCGRPAPSDDDHDLPEWEVTDDDNADDGCAWICPDCITPEEQQAIDEDGMNFIDEMDMGRAVDKVFGVNDD